MGIDTKAADAITQATISFFKTMLAMDVTHGEATETIGPASQPSISATIGISGDLSGSMSLHVHPDVAGNIMESWIGERLAPETAECHDGIGEIVNIVLGDAKTTMSSGNINFTFSIPHVIFGSEYQINYPADVSIQNIGFDSPLGTFEVEIVAVKES